MTIKNFKIEFNQNIWDSYIENQLEKGRKITSLKQYKPAVLAFEEMFNIKLSELTVEQIDHFIKSNVIKNTSHIKGFLITCISEDFLEVNKGVLAYLIPIEYKKLASLLLLK